MADYFSPTLENENIFLIISNKPKTITTKSWRGEKCCRNRGQLFLNQILRVNTPKGQCKSACSLCLEWLKTAGGIHNSGELYEPFPNGYQRISGRWLKDKV